VAAAAGHLAEAAATRAAPNDAPYFEAAAWLNVAVFRVQMQGCRGVPEFAAFIMHLGVLESLGACVKPDVCPCFNGCLPLAGATLRAAL
jgi:hypothetical protein